MIICYIQNLVTKNHYVENQKNIYAHALIKFMITKNLLITLSNIKIILCNVVYVANEHTLCLE